MSDVKIPNYPELAGYKPVEDFDGDVDNLGEVSPCVEERKQWFVPKVPDCVPYNDGRQTFKGKQTDKA